MDYGLDKGDAHTLSCEYAIQRQAQGACQRHLTVTRQRLVFSARGESPQALSPCPDCPTERAENAPCFRDLACRQYATQRVKTTRCHQHAYEVVEFALMQDQRF